ncbi:MAG: Vms1/Ankzf1 family peptidyl-tRNA hydrolase [Halobacteria archaeon]
MSLFDEVLGKKELKQKVQELKEEKESLESQLEAENRRRKDAVTEKQKAEREINELETKIATMEDELEKASGEKEEEHEFIRVRRRSLHETQEFLKYLGSMEDGDGNLASAYLPKPAESLPEVMDELFPEDERVNGTGGGKGGLERERKLLRRAYRSSRNGLAVFRDELGLLRVTLEPPLPVQEGEIVHDDGYLLKENLFLPNDRYAVAVVRSDSFAAGVYEGCNRKEYIRVDSSVKESHSKGGYSQSRFERKRENQIQSHVEESATEFDELLSDSRIEFVAVLGQGSVCTSFVEETRYDGEVIQKSSDARGKGEDLLRDGYMDFWSTLSHIF